MKVVWEPVCPFPPKLPSIILTRYIPQAQVLQISEGEVPEDGLRDSSCKEDSRAPGPRATVSEPSLEWSHPVSVSPGFPGTTYVNVREEGGSESLGIRK